MNSKKRSNVIKILFLYIIIMAVFTAVYLYVANTPMIRLSNKVTTPDNTYDKTYVIVVDKDNPPYSYYNDNGDFVGFDVDLIGLIANKGYFNVDLRPMDWASCVDAIESGEADIIMSYSNLKKTDTNILYSHPIYNNPYSLFAQKGVNEKTTNIYSSTIAVMDKAAFTYLEDFGLSKESVKLPSNDDILDKLYNGEVDYAVMRKYTGKYELSKNNISGIVCLKSLDDGAVCIGVSKSKHVLYVSINKILESYGRDNTLIELEEKWVPQALKGDIYEDKNSNTNFIFFSGLTLLISVGIILFLSLKGIKNEDKLADTVKRNQVYRDSINASSVGYFEVNLTKDIVVSEIYESVDGKYISVSEQINLPKPMRYTDFYNFLLGTKIITAKNDFINTFNRINLIHANDDGDKMHEITCQCYMITGPKSWLRILVCTSRDDYTGDVSAVFVLYDVSHLIEEQTKQELKNTALLGMSKDYDSVSYINIINGEESLYHISPIFEELLGKRRRYLPFSEKMSYLADALVVPGERDRFIKETTRSLVLERLNENDTYTVHTKLDIKGVETYYEFKFVRDDDNTNGIIFGTRNIDKETRKELDLQKNILQNNNIINILASEYSSVFYLDPGTKKISPYQVSPLVKEQLEPIFESGSDYRQLLLFFLNKYVNEDDRENIKKYADFENVINELHDKKSFSIIYRTDDANHILRYHELKIVKIDEDENVTGIALAFADKDDEICNRFIREKTMEEYDALYIIDLEHDSFRTIKSSDNFDADSLANGVYSKAMRLYSYQLRSEYFDIWTRLVSPKYMQQYMENDDRREFIFRLPSVINSWRRAIIQVVERKEGVATELVVSFMGIDSARAEMLDMSLKTEDQKKVLEERQALLEEARTNAEHANAAKSSFLFNMSHDIRTPMNAIQGFTAIARKNMDNKEKVAECLEKIEISGNHLLDLINDVLDMARIESGKVALEEVPCNIRKESNEIVTMVREMATAKEIEMDLNIKSIRNEEVFADPLRVNQIFINLLSNAVKYTKPGGKVVYTISQKNCKDPGYASYEFVVEDNGIGMTKEYVDHIFEAFTREKNSTTSGVQGTGLGMAITKELIDLMGGTIKIDTKLGEGTKVTVCIKLRLVDHALKEIEAKEQQQDINLKGRRVLLVEDNEFNREIARDILVDEGIEVDEAEDGSVAVDKILNSEAGHYDFVLMDIQMPVLDGYSATEQIRKFEDKGKASVPIIAMTANAFDEDKAKAKSTGMDAFVSKPINIAYLLQTLQSFANKKK